MAHVVIAYCDSWMNHCVISVMNGWAVVYALNERLKDSAFVQAVFIYSMQSKNVSFEPIKTYSAHHLAQSLLTAIFSVVKISVPGDAEVGLRLLGTKASDAGWWTVKFFKDLLLGRGGGQFDSNVLKKKKGALCSQCKTQVEARRAIILYCVFWHKRRDIAYS